MTFAGLSLNCSQSQFCWYLVECLNNVILQQFRHFLMTSCKFSMVFLVTMLCFMFPGSGKGTTEFSASWEPVTGGLLCGMWIS